MTNNFLDPQQFKRIATRNTILPLALAMLLSGVFIGLIFKLVSVNQWVDHTNQVIAATHQCLQKVIDSETGLRGFVVTNRESFLEPYYHAKENLNADLEDLTRLVADNPVQVVRLKSIQEKVHFWMDFTKDVLKDNQPQTTKAKIIATERGKRIVESIRQQFSEFSMTEESLRDQRSRETRRTVQLVLFLVISLSLVIGALIAFYSRRQLNLVSTLYGSALQKQSEQNEKLQKQAWLSSSQVELAQRIRGELDTKFVCSEILKFLCSYLDAKVASLYLVEPNGSLTLYSTYGVLGQATELSRNLSPGSNLASEAARDQRIMVLDPAPAEHLKMVTTLGSSTPVSILIAPAITNLKAKAIMEFGLLRKVVDRDSELLETLSEQIGVAITSAQYRVKVRDLLEESQRQAEELQTQQEELKVNNEELEEQAKALRESQARLESQQAELEQNNSQLAQQARTLEIQNNELNDTKLRLEHKAKELERTSTYKSQFLANMSHELRTPLNSTLLLSQLLLDNKEGRLDAEQLEYARTILSSSNDLLTLINDILDLAKVESGTVQLLPVFLDLSELLSGLDRSFRPQAQQNAVLFSLKLDADVPLEIFIDRQKLEQILKNLISNAIKFTSQGEVRVLVKKSGSRNLSFTVLDTGIGIPKNKQDIIFEAFQQADGTTSRQFGGTGLGLTISRDLAKLLGGSISIESEVGKGSVFTLVVPISAVPTLTSINTENDSTHGADMSMNQGRGKLPEPEKKSSDDSSKKSAVLGDDLQMLDRSRRILMIVEDDTVFTKILVDLAHDQEFQVIVAHTAQQAVQMAKEHLPHAIILDMHLPDHSGLYVLDRLKESKDLRHIPVHVVSGQDLSATSMQMGVIGYLMKPADRTQLVEVMEKLESRLFRGIKKVLIVEDNEVQRQSMKKLISDPNVEVEIVETGAEALRMLKEHSYDCLVLDLTLPDMSGYEVLERMSAQESVSYPPVIIYTAKSLSRQEEEKLQRYSQSIILKGAKSPERLMSEVSLFLHQLGHDAPLDKHRMMQELRDREKTLDGRTILLVDDDVRNIFALNSALHPRGAKTEIARNGKEALLKLEANPAIELVLMDIMMPEMDGYEAMRLIRANPKHRKLPIIAVTAKAMPDDQEKCIEAGASDYLAKPIDLSKLLSLMKVWLHPNGRLG